MVVYDIIVYLKYMENKTLDDVLKLPLYKSIFHRLPWLIIGLIGGVMAAKVVVGFEEILEKNLFLAAFIPLIVYMSDAVGTQMESFAIRDLAMHSHMKLIRYFLRQLIVVSLMGIILSVCLIFISLLMGQEIRVGITLGISLFAAVMSSLLTGILIPYLFNRIKLDPANASGPIATIIQDLFSVSIYFYIASLLLN